MSFVKCINDTLSDYYFHDFAEDDNDDSDDENLGAALKRSKIISMSTIKRQKKIREGTSIKLLIRFGILNYVGQFLNFQQDRDVDI